MFKRVLLLVCIQLAFTWAVQLDPGQQQILVDLYQNTTGSEWTSSRRWAITMDATVDCDTLYGVSCDQFGFVTSLILPSTNLKGPIPTSFGGLTRLQTLNLCFNSLTSLPDEMAELVALENYYICGYERGPRVPATFNQMTGLVIVTIWGGDFVSVPSYFSNFHSLSVLDLGRMYINQTISEILDILRPVTTLKTLVLSFNDIVGTFPADFDQFQLNSLVIDNNQIASIADYSRFPPALTNCKASMNPGMSFQYISPLSPWAACIDASCSGTELTQGVCTPNQFMCFDGSCVASASQCMCQGQNALKCQDGTCYTDNRCCSGLKNGNTGSQVIRTNIVMLDGPSVTVNMTTTNSTVLGFVELDVASLNVTDAFLKVQPATVNIKSVALNNNTQLVTPVVDLSILVNGNIFNNFTGENFARITLQHPSSLRLNGTACLAYVDVAKSAWVCQDDQLTVNDDGETVSYTGLTAHFTNYGILLSGRNEPNKKDSPPFDLSWKIAVGVVLGFVGASIIVAAIIFLMLRQKRARRTRQLSQINNKI